MYSKMILVVRRVDRAVGLMDMASASGAGDFRLESWAAQYEVVDSPGEPLHLCTDAPNTTWEYGPDSEAFRVWQGRTVHQRQGLRRNRHR